MNLLFVVSGCGTNTSASEEENSTDIVSETYSRVNKDTIDTPDDLEIHENIPNTNDEPNNKVIEDSNISKEMLNSDTLPEILFEKYSSFNNELYCIMFVDKLGNIRWCDITNIRFSSADEESTYLCALGDESIIGHIDQDDLMKYYDMFLDISHNIEYEYSHCYEDVLYVNMSYYVFLNSDYDAIIFAESGQYNKAPSRECIVYDEAYEVYSWLLNVLNDDNFPFIDDFYKGASFH